MSQPEAARPAEDDLFELAVGEPAAGGGCVARAPDGRVVFVRYALPGELVRARITAETRHFLRADAIEVLEASPDRVEPPCPVAGPGRCGGCDYQHVALPAQRRWKARLVETQLERLAGLHREVQVEPLAGAADGLGWRTRIRFAADRRGRLGLHRHRSHELELLEGCPLATPGVAAVAAPTRRWPGARHVEVFAPTEASDGAGALVVVDAAIPPGRAALPRLRPGVGLAVAGEVRQGPGHLEAVAAGHRFQVSAGAFWQVHLAAPDALVAAVLALADPRPGERVADLYAGVGLFAVALATAVGPSGHVLAVERHRAASVDLAQNTAELPWVEVQPARVEARTLVEAGPLDLVVLDPPREGAGRDVMTALAAVPGLRAVASVACDPASFARDARVLLDAGWTLDGLRALDAFPMTEHVELVGLLRPPGAVHATGR